MADQQRRRGVVLSQIIGCRDKILNIGRELVFAKSPSLPPIPVKSNRSTAIPRASEHRRSRCRKDVLAAGEAVGEQRKRARLDRQIKTSRQIAPRRTEETRSSSIRHVQLLVRSRRRADDALPARHLAHDRPRVDRALVADPDDELVRPHRIMRVSYFVRPSA
jgi:hypothetical protein